MESPSPATPDQRTMSMRTAALGYDVVGTVPAAEYGGLTILKLPRVRLLSVELGPRSPCRRDRAMRSGLPDGAPLS